jgi:hypothetical protein
MPRIGSAGVLALVLLISAGCSRLVPLQPSSAVLLAQAQQPDLVRAAIARALSARNFVAESEQPGVIIARYDRRGQTLRVQIAYSESQYQITYLDSVGFGQVVDERGQTMIGAGYPRQVRALSSSIDDEIARPAREAEEAVQRERQHQLELAQQETQRQQAALDAQQRERDSERNAALEAERLRTERARAEAEARRPVIIAPGQGSTVGGLAFEPRGRARPSYGTIRVRGRLGQTEDGYAGGPMPASALSFPDYCVGFYSEQPSHVLRLDRATSVRVEVGAQIDTTLAIVTSDGSVWCDDDGAGGVNPRIEGALPAGTYYVWVGAYAAGQQAPYQIHLLEPHTQQQPQVAQGPARTPACTQAMIQRGYSGGDLAYCDGVDASCAVAMIQRGYSGSDVQYCRGVEPSCAEAMIQRGYSGSDVQYCQGVEPSCAVAAIQRGYSGRDVGNCR